MNTQSCMFACLKILRKKSTLALWMVSHQSQGFFRIVACSVRARDFRSNPVSSMICGSSANLLIPGSKTLKGRRHCDLCRSVRAQTDGALCGVQIRARLRAQANLALSMVRRSVHVPAELALTVTGGHGGRRTKKETKRCILVLSISFRSVRGLPS